MTQPQQQPTQSTPISVVPPSPANMPGARQNTTPASVDPDSRSQPGGFVTEQPAPQQPSTPQQSPTKQPPTQQPPTQQPQQQPDPQQQQPETVEMTRFKAVQQIARNNEEDARAYRKLMDELGVKPEEQKNFDPQAEISKLRTDFESERDARLREQISHTTGVPVGQIRGTTQDEMQASAKEATDWLNSKLQQANAPAAAPASTVNSSATPNEGAPKQFQSQDELSNMTQKQIMEAYRGGQLDHLMGKQT